MLLGMNKALPSLRQGGWAQGQGYMAGVGFKATATDRDPVVRRAGEGRIEKQGRKERVQGGEQRKDEREEGF